MAARTMRRRPPAPRRATALRPHPHRSAALRPAPAQALRVLFAVAFLLLGGLLPPAATAATAATVTAATTAAASAPAPPHTSAPPPATRPYARSCAHPNAHPWAAAPRLAARAAGDHPHPVHPPVPGVLPSHGCGPRLRAGLPTPQLRATADRLRYAGRCLDRAPPRRHR
ncbi:hypothetical protein ACFVTP_23090 [Streptomyces celluloflavus]|uniref:hypothetical protein n=1 Tax=Streptomyces celluloflavus TaxID=58344 RepID=UPI0036DBDFD0